MEEIWKEIESYPNYLISSLGRVKSISRIILKGGKYPSLSKEKIMKPNIREGYLYMALSSNSIRTKYNIHVLVAMAFLNHVPNGHNIEVDHIDNNKLNNRIDNLQLLSCRENSTKTARKGTSNYTGVYWGKTNNKWIAEISINNKKKILGYFNNEIEASTAYQTTLNTL